MPSITIGLAHFYKAISTMAERTKKGIRLFVTTISLLGLVACGGEKAEDNVTTIGVAIPNFDDTFLVSLKSAMERYTQEKYPGKVELIIVDAKEDTAKQLGQIQNFIVQQMDAIILVPVNTEATQPMTDAIQKAGIELVYLNRRPSYLPDGVSYVGSDEIKFGEAQARYVDEHSQGGNIGILMGMMTTEAAVLRTQGNEDYFKGNPNYNVIRKQTALWQRSQGMIVMENWISSGDKLDVILANNDDMALGAIQALKAAGKLDKTMVIGVDATPDGVMAVKNGTLDATVFQDGAGQARGSIDAAMDAINKKPHEKITWIPAELVTKDNLEEFMAKKG
ncbi:sugar ABC transporter substrate-binding protein [Vibrio sp. MACH09]|uniref:sugar ABC transporter substrate-binding protein n=1 Tax=unclassified Vibrio TaxID=2614977 RepID=UPI0014939B08|nr:MULTISPECIES: sugar ABC transporter substrate-binding protein [unclassified Vibrio]NOI67546.1 sugar ABC transporter substrate-binding protein [Vibrio sp. 99-8-1]GLO63865.1 sugar ABC transporter substrate-binding protein [Vibrio sp. MACH09]